MRIGTITPTLGRPKFLAKSREYMQRQTREPDFRIVIDYEQRRFPHDITDRYKAGIEILKNKTDLIFFIEDDDYYRPEYIEKMIYWFELMGRPDVFGIGETFFYHPEFSGVYYRKHDTESPCAYQMVLKTEAIHKIDWSLIGETFTDVGIWRQLAGKAVCFGNPLAIGIKHGIGVTGAGAHNKWFYDDQVKKFGSSRVSNQWADIDPKWLREQIGNDAIFYERQEYK